MIKRDVFVMVLLVLVGFFLFQNSVVKTSGIGAITGYASGEGGSCLHPLMENSYERYAFNILTELGKEDTLTKENLNEMWKIDIRDIRRRNPDFPDWKIKKIKEAILKVGYPELVSIILEINELNGGRPVVFIKEGKEGDLESGRVTNTALSYTYNTRTDAAHFFGNINGRVIDTYLIVSNDEFWKIFKDIQKSEDNKEVNNQWQTTVDYVWDKNWGVRGLGDISEIYKAGWGEGEWKGQYADEERIAILFEAIRRGENIGSLAPGWFQSLEIWWRNVYRPGKAGTATSSLRSARVPGLG